MGVDLRTLVLATRNDGKVREIRQLLSGLSLDVVTLARHPGAPAVSEDGTTYHENATLKAAAIARFTNCWAMGEDSGLEVDALGGRPGIHSARYAGDDRSNNEKLIRELLGVPDPERTARYRCVAVIVDPQGREIAKGEGSCEGRIGHEARGSGGFGYDPFFLPEGFDGRTMAELGDERKNRISHRAHALAQLKRALIERVFIHNASSESRSPKVHESGPESDSPACDPSLDSGPSTLD